jgi:hypothetical protein
VKCWGVFPLCGLPRNATEWRTEYSGFKDWADVPVELQFVLCLV